MNILEDTMLLYRVAKSYYINGLGQNEIAKMTGISRPQISRLIKRAQELGIVKIDVNLPKSIHVKDIERELASCLGLKHVVIAPSSLNEEADDFFSFAATRVAEHLEGCNNIGIGWGRSVYHVSRLLSYQRNCEQTVFYPLVGCSGTDNAYLQMSSITDRFAEHYHAKARYLNLPVFRQKSSLTAEESAVLKQFKASWQHLDAAVIGIGAFNTENEFYIDEASYNPYLRSHKNEVTGDILGHFFRKDGGVLVLPDYYHIACSLDDLKAIPRVIAVAKNAEKADIIYRVAKGGFITTLITDDTTAKAILEEFGFRK